MIIVRRLIAALVASTVLVAGAPAGARPSTRPASQPTGSAPAAEYRFDALRFAGELAGPHALVVGARWRSGKRPPLHKARQRFVQRLFETVEAPALQR